MPGKKSKKTLAFILGFAVLIAAVVGFFIFRGGKGEEQESREKEEIIQTINQKPVKERPYLSLTPSASGGEVFISINHAQAELAEYEIEYQATGDSGGTIIQGGIGRIDLSSQSQPTEPKEFCFCSQSKGKKKYDQGVSGGSVVIHFSGGQEDFSLKGDFTIGKMEEEEGVFTSRNSKVQLQVPETELGLQSPLVVLDPLGLPGKLEKEILEGPYAFFTPQGTSVDKATLTLKTKENLSTAKLLGWDAEAGEWEEYEFEAEEEQAVAEIDGLTTFLLVD